MSNEDRYDKIEATLQIIAENVQDIKDGNIKIKVPLTINRHSKPQYMEIDWILQELWDRPTNKLNDIADTSSKTLNILKLVMKILGIMGFVGWMIYVILTK